MKVFKFGGASVKDAAAFDNVAHIISTQQLGEPLLVVVSAMGKTTNALEKVFDHAFKGQDFEPALQESIAYHSNILQQLFPDPEHPAHQHLDKLFYVLRSTLLDLKPLHYDKQYDQIISFGEIFASTILHHYLLSRQLPSTWLDCRKYIQTDDTWREARVNWAWTEKLIQRDLPELLKQQVIITQGFIGGTIDGLTTTLGREGSDYSAAIFAFCLQASSLTIWKDVAGLLNADPKFFKDTVRYDELSFQETVEMAYYGASVIHPKTIKPLANCNIPLYVKSFLNPEGPGTKITNVRNEKVQPAFICKPNQCLVSFSVKDFTFVSEKNLGTIFNVLSDLRIKINLMQNSAISFSICTDYNEERLQKLLLTLQDEFFIHYNQPLVLYTIKNYDNESMERLTHEREILLEQRTRNTFQFVAAISTALTAHKPVLD